MPEISRDEARRLRARSQLLAGSELTPAQVVARAGALQGQDLGAVLRAIGLRSSASVAEVRSAFESGELVRGWPMRGTLFAITPADLAAIVAITGPRQQTSLRARRAFLGLSEEDYELARAVAADALAAGRRARAELAELWAQAGVPQGPGHTYHFVSTLAIGGVLHLGGFDGSDQFVERALEPVEDEAAFLTRFARAYFVARGPATIDDLAWWTKLPKAVLRPAVDRIDGLETLAVEGLPTRYLDDGVGTAGVPAVVLVPAFDEWILGYQDRSLIASEAAQKTIATVNGLFRPAVLVDGRAVGIWSVVKGRAVLGELVEPVTARQRKAIDAAIEAWSD